MAGIPGQPTPKPADLSQPVPEPPAAPDLGVVPNFSTPTPMTPNQPQAEAAPAAEPSIDDLIAQMNSIGQEPAAPDNKMSTMPEPEGWASAKEQVREAGTRLKNAFTVTGRESTNVLRDSGMFEDVRQVGDVVQVKRKGRDGWETFDRDKLELLGDTIDFARDAFEGIVDGVVRGGAVAAGTIAAPGVGTAVGALASGAGGALVAKNAGDLVAQEVLGIERDPRRSQVNENTLAAAFGAGFNFLGSSLARRAASNKAVQAEARKTLDFAAKQAASVADDIMEVKNSGIVLGENGRFHLDPQQVIGHGNIPEIDVTARELSTEQSFRNFRRQVGDNIKDAYDGVAKSLGSAAGHGANLGDDFALTSKDIRQVEGKLIGSFRAMADNKLAGMPQVAPRTLQTIQAMEQSLTDSNLGKMTVDSVIANSPGLSESQARVLIGQVERMKGIMKKGTLTLDQANALKDGLNVAINKGSSTAAGRPYSMALIDLRNALRDDHTDMMGAVLPKAYQESYKASLGRYRQIMDSTAQLGSLLDTENISKNELLGKLFETKGSYKFAQSAKTLLNETNPGMWDNLSSEYLRKLRVDATDLANGNVNWTGVARKWGNLDARLQQEILQSTGIPKDGMNALLKLGIRTQDADFKALAKEGQMGAIKGTIKSLFNMAGGASAKGTAITSLLDGMGKNQGLAKWLQEGGMEEILKEMPGMKATKRAALRDWIGNWAPAKLSKATDMAVDQGFRTTIRRRGEEAVAP